MRRYRSLSLWRRLKRYALVALIVPYALALLYWVVPPVSTLMLARIVQLKSVSRQWVPLEQVSPQLVAAVVSAEDSAFCDHFGFDFGQIEKNLDKAASGKHFGGASTITQQTAKNLFLWNGRSWLRKMLEAPLALWLELVWSKRRILEVYLNVAEWGDGVFGAEAAARYHFGTPARNLSLAQASLLAVSLPDPTRRTAGRPGYGQILAASALARRLIRGGPDLSCLRK